MQLSRYVSCTVACFVVTLVAPAGARAAPWSPAAAIDDDLHWSRDVELVDLDNDGWVDILFANVGGVFQDEPNSHMPNQAYLNIQGAGFQAISAEVFGLDPNEQDPVQLKDSAHALATCDLDADGDQDIVIGATWHQQSRLLLNDGLGGFTDVTDAMLPAIEASVLDVECGDVDGDGDLDLVLTDAGPEPIGQVNSLGGVTMLWLNQGPEGNWAFVDATETQMPAVAVNYALDLDFVDVDNDYDLDLVIACRACITGSLLYVNDGLGVFTPATPATFSEVGNFEFEAADLNGDGFLDLLTLGDGEGGLDGVRDRILINDGAGDYTDETVTYWPLIENPGSGDRAAAFLDHDSDGDGDVVLGTNAAAMWPPRLMVRDGALFVQDTAPFGALLVEGTQDLESADLDGDDHPDLVLAAGENAFENRVLLGDVIETSADQTSPALFVEALSELAYPGEVVVHARVHDHKTPNKPHDWERVYLEWQEGELDGDALDQNGIRVDARWYGEHMFVASYQVPDAASSSYRQCAIDIAGNMSCSQVHVVTHDAGGDTGSTTGDGATDTDTDTETGATTGDETDTEEGTGGGTGEGTGGGTGASTGATTGDDGGDSTGGSSAGGSSGTGGDDDPSAGPTTDSGAGEDDSPSGCGGGGGGGGLCVVGGGPSPGAAVLGLIALCATRRRRRAFTR